MKTKLLLPIIVSFIFSGLVYIAPSYARPEISIAGSTLSSSPILTFSSLYSYNILYKDCKLFPRTPTWMSDIIYVNTYDCREAYLLSAISYYESTFNPDAKNAQSSASGLFQYLDSTWVSHRCGALSDKRNPSKQLRCALNDIRAGRLKQWAVWPKVI